MSRRLEQVRRVARTMPIPVPDLDQISWAEDLRNTDFGGLKLRRSTPITTSKTECPPLSIHVQYARAFS